MENEEGRQRRSCFRRGDGAATLLNVVGGGHRSEARRDHVELIQSRRRSAVEKLTPLHTTSISKTSSNE